MYSPRRIDGTGRRPDYIIRIRSSPGHCQNMRTRHMLSFGLFFSFSFQSGNLRMQRMECSPLRTSTIAQLDLSRCRCRSLELVVIVSGICFTFTSSVGLSYVQRSVFFFYVELSCGSGSVFIRSAARERTDVAEESAGKRLFFHYLCACLFAMFAPTFISFLIRRALSLPASVTPPFNTGRVVVSAEFRALSQPGRAVLSAVTEVRHFRPMHTRFIVIYR